MMTTSHFNKQKLIDIITNIDRDEISAVCFITYKSGNEDKIVNIMSVDNIINFMSHVSASVIKSEKRASYEVIFKTISDVLYNLKRED
ncbi:MAG: hypothetical protein JXR36_04130 [Bacteroidales bacterium]|nr:hypothetical protein [Bacteroidales bacterium]